MNDTPKPGALAERAPGQLLPASALRDRINLLQDIMSSVMKPGVHYGKIPGAGDKPCLFLPGAEIIMATFQLAPSPEVEDLSREGKAHFRIKLHLLRNGELLGTGIGEASSAEEKYQWRKAIAPAEFDATPEVDRRLRWRKGGQDGPYQEKQIKTNPADVANTILKMAKKRALIDGVRMVTGCSDLFEQDVEDLPEEVLAREREGEAAVRQNEAGVDQERRKRVVANIEAQLKAGIPLEVLWKATLKEDRVAVGEAEWLRLRKLASAPAQAAGGAQGAQPAGGAQPADAPAGVAPAREPGGDDNADHNKEWKDQYDGDTPPGGKP